MTFLNPLLLIGLAAAAIPIILHLINLRKLRTIEFSTIAFLKDLQRTKIRRLKIRQILLLVVRTLLVVLLVLAFSRPTLRGHVAAGFGSQAKTTAVILIDDSRSMEGSDEHGELVKQAREAAAHVVDLMREGDEVTLLKLSDFGPGSSAEQFPPQRSFAALRSAIAHVKPTSIHRKLNDAVRFSAKLLALSKNFNKEVYIISDFQKGAFENSPRNVEELFPSEVRFFLLRIGERQPHNLGVGETTIASAILEKDRPFLLKTQIGNYSTKDVRNHVVSVFLHGTRVAEQGLELRSGQVLQTEFSVVPKRAGIVEGFVELENDDLEFDNRRYFSAFIPEQLRVLLVGKPADLRYLRLAFNTRQAAPSTIRIQETEPERMTATLLGSSDVIILANIRSLPAQQVEGLRAFLQAGGGLLIFPGSETTASAFNAAFAPLKLPALVAVESLGLKGAYTEAGSFLTFGRVELEHPLFEGMFEQEPSVSRLSTASSPRSVESPEIRTFARFSPSAASTTIITLSNGIPFLLEHRLGEGRVFVLSVSADVQWSNFPLKGLFVPFLHQAVLFLTRQQAAQKSVLAGEETLLTSLPAGPGQITIENPQKIELVVHPSRSGMTRTLRFGETGEIGTYRVKAGPTIARTFTVNMDPSESNTVPVEAAAVERMFNAVGVEGSAVRQITQPTEVQRTVLETRYGTELWKHLLIAALLIAVAEMVLAREGRKDEVQPLLSTS